MLYTVLLILIILFFALRKTIFKWRERWFASFMAHLSNLYNEATDGTKQKLFSPLQEIISADPLLKSKNQIRVLEIGCGSGSNFKYFPAGSNLMVVDTNTSFEKRLRENLTKFPMLRLEKLVHASAEDMKDIPSESIDAVVSTCVLCSVGDLSKVLDEVQRVLVPSGKFFFLEHVVEKKGTFLYIVQWLLTKSGIWPTLFCGCHLTRDIGTTIKQANFTTAQVENFEFKSQARIVFKFIKPHICGIATK